MFIKIWRLFCISFLILAIPSISNACRLWVSVSEDRLFDRIDTQLLDAPMCIRAQGQKYDDGWAIAYYQNDIPVIQRAAESSYEDATFLHAAKHMARANAKIKVAHLRKASSGCVENVANPHPFIRKKFDKTWLFAHNGGVKKDLLISLIGQEYLDQNKPTTCIDNPPDSWVDSELYFIYLMRAIELAQGDVVAGLTMALETLYEHINKEYRYLNFYLTDGKKVWVFRRGNELYYYKSLYPKTVQISSTIPMKNTGNWLEFPLDAIGEIDENYNLKFYPLNEYIH